MLLKINILVDIRKFLLISLPFKEKIEFKLDSNV